MRALRFTLGLLIALVVHFVGMQFFPWFTRAFDLFLVIVVFHSMDGATVAGMLGGMAAGLLTDSLTGGAIGLFGMADTIVGYGTAATAQRLVIQRAGSSFLVFSLAAATQQALLVGITLLLIPNPEAPDFRWVLIKVLTTGILGLVLYLSSTRMRTRMEARRRSKTAKIRFDR